MAGLGTRMIQSGGASALAFAARIAEQLLLVPILLAAWSVDLFGEYLLIAAIPTYVALSDLGVVQSGSNELARRAAAGDENEARRFFTDYLVTFLRWSGVLLVGFLIAIWFAPLGDWLRLEQIGDEEAKMAFGLLVAATLVSQNSLALLGGMRARQIMPRGLWVRALGAVGRILAVIVLVSWYDGGPVAVAGVMLASRVLEYAIQSAMLAADGFPAPLNPLASRTESLRGYLGSGIEFMLFPLAQALLLQGTVVALGLTLGAVAVAIFSTHRTLARSIAQIAQIAIVPLRAESGLLSGEGDKPVLARLLVSTSRLTLWTCAAVAICLFLAGPWVFAEWTGEKIAFAPLLFAGLVVAVMLEALWSVTSSVRMGTNRHRPLAWSFLGVSAIALAAVWFVAQSAGLSAIAIVLVAADLAMCLLAIPLTVRLLDLPSARYLRDLARPPLAELAFILRKLKRPGH